MRLHDSRHRSSEHLQASETPKVVFHIPSTYRASAALRFLKAIVVKLIVNNVLSEEFQISIVSTPTISKVVPCSILYVPPRSFLKVFTGIEWLRTV